MPKTFVMRVLRQRPERFKHVTWISSAPLMESSCSNWLMMHHRGNLIAQFLPNGRWDNQVRGFSHLVWPCTSQRNARIG